MTQFQPVASSTRKSVVSRPESKLLTHVSLWTVRVPELRSQQIERPRWPHTGQQTVSHCHLEGNTKPYIHSKSRQSAYTPAAANIWRRWHCWEQKYPTITKNSSTNKHRSPPGLQRHFYRSANAMHDVAERRENCNIGTITAMQILCSINRKSDRKTLQILITAPELHIHVPHWCRQRSASWNSDNKDMS